MNKNFIQLISILLLLLNFLIGGSTGKIKGRIIDDSNKEPLVGVNIYLDGGQLSIDWLEDGIWMTGPTSFVFKGILSSEFLESVK